MHDDGGGPWLRWNGALRDLLIALQSHSGHAAGGWVLSAGHDQQGGRLYVTALAR